MDKQAKFILVSKTIGWLLLALIFILLILIPLLTSTLIKLSQLPIGALEYWRYIESSQAALMKLLGVIWIFFLGGCFASFLNVVAWRLPRGRGVNGSSMCPFCETELLFSDNLPVFGWIRNSGQCRSCRAPIPPRYLIVEVFLGCVFLLICSLEILAGGFNLPIRDLVQSRGFEHLIFDPKWDLIQIASYHLVLICLLFTFSLIRSERLQVPRNVFFWGLIFGFGLPFVWPNMMFISWHIDTHHLIDMARGSTTQLITLAYGLTAGAACGLLSSWATLNPKRILADRIDQSTIEQFNSVDDVIASLSLVGIFLGWQSALSVTLFFLLIQVVVLMAARGGRAGAITPSITVFVATLLHLLTWRAFTFVPVWPSPSVDAATIAGILLAILSISMVIRKLGAASFDRQGR
jgi:leader peptidase (prepilin peptidase)/N-methyltransferase